MRMLSLLFHPLSSPSLLCVFCFEYSGFNGFFTAQKWPQLSFVSAFCVIFHVKDNQSVEYRRGLVSLLFKLASHRQVS